MLKYLNEPVFHPPVIGGYDFGEGNGFLTKDGKPIHSNLQGVCEERHSWFSPAETFRGSYFESAQFALVGSGRPDIGTLIGFAKGTGSGEHYLHDRHWTNFETAIQFGEAVDDKGCDSTTIERCTFVDCGTAIRFKNTMAMTQEIRNLVTSGVTNVIVLEAGGKSMADGIYVNYASEANAGGAVLLIDPVKGGIGSNNNRFTLRNISYDQQAGNHIAIVRMAQHIKSGYWLSIDGGGVACDDYGNGKYLLELRNPFYVSVRHFQGLQRGSVKIHHDPKLPMGALVVDSCEIRGCAINEILADDSPVRVVVAGGIE